MGPTHCILFRDPDNNVMKSIYVTVIDSEPMEIIMLAVAKLLNEMPLPDGYSIDITVYNVNN